jgi:Fe-S-cluster containining protein
MSKTIEEVWASVPDDMECKGLCADYCGPVDASRVERRRLREQGARLPALPELQIGGKVEPCPLLVDGRCSVYEDRPLICRVWGNTERLACEHGCRPARYMTDWEARVAFAQARAIP